MKTPGLAALGVIALASLALGQPVEVNQPESPARPRPAWVKMIDQGQFNPDLKGYFTPEGLVVEVVAREPQVINPVGMTFADDGMLYVLEWTPDSGYTFGIEVKETFKYKDGTTRQIACMKKKVKDIVKTLHDSNVDGVYDQARVILDEVELPSSILLHDGWLYLSGRGRVYRYRLADLKGSPRAESRKPVAETIAHGFCGFHHHQVSGLTIGNDGWLYVTSGDDDNYVEGSDGSRTTVLRTGAVFRMRPDGSRVHVYSQGYRNPYRDVAFDELGNIFHVDNDNEDGSKFTGCRLMHVAEESDFGWRLRQGARCCVPDSLRGAVFGERPGKLPALLKTGRGASAGLLIYNESHLPERYRGLLIYPDVFRKLIRAYRVAPKGASFEVVEEFELLKSDDPLFRPCQAVVGPDGAIYVCDWRTDSGGAGKLWGDGKHGRIYRIRAADNQAATPLRPMDNWQKYVKGTDDELLKALESPNFSDRHRVQQELRRRGDRLRLLTLLTDKEKPLTVRIAALGVLHTLWNAKVQEAFVKLLRDAEPDLRRLAADGLSLNCVSGDEDVQDALLKSLADDSPAVRRGVALAMGRIAASGAADALVNAYKFDEAKDIYLQDGLLRAIERLGKPGIDRLESLADSGNAKDQAIVVRAFAGLRTRPAAEAIPRLLANPHLTDQQRVVILRSYRDYLLDPPISLEPVLRWLDEHPTAPVNTKLAALESLSLGGSLKGDQATQTLLRLLNDADEGVRISVIRAVQDTQLRQAAAPLARMLADKHRTNAERTAVVTALRVLNDRAAVPVLRGILTDDPAAALWPEALQTLAALDPAAARPFAESFLERDVTLQKEAILILGNQPEGAKLVGERYLAKKLPRDLLPQVSEVLRKHTARGAEFEKLLKEVMQGTLLLSLQEEKELARLTKDVRERGNASRGRDLYVGSKTLQCAQCHSLEGVGGNVGPDLTRVWETLSDDKVLESLIEPSKEIKEGYQTYILETKRGQVLRGLKVSQNQLQVTLRDAERREHTIPAEQVEQLAVDKKSLMPDNVLAQLSYDQFLDLVAFLKNREAQESLRGRVLEWWVVGPFGGSLQELYPPEKEPDPTKTYLSAEGKKIAWQVVRAQSDGFLNLFPLYQQDNVTAYALTYVFSPKAQRTHLLVGSDDRCRVWLNGKQVHEFTGNRSPRPDEDDVVVELRAGWNTLLVKVVNDVGGHGLYLRLSGGEGLCTGMRPEGK